jgi:predicted solute-binding protein
MKNTIGTCPKMKNKKFVSTKLGHLGLGTSIMEEIAEKYYGNVNYDYSEEYFETKIILSSGTGNE